MEARVIAAIVLDRCRLVLDKVRLQVAISSVDRACRASTRIVVIDLIKGCCGALFARKIVFFAFKWIKALRSAWLRVSSNVLLGGRLHTLVAVRVTCCAWPSIDVRG